MSHSRVRTFTPRFLLLLALLLCFAGATSTPSGVTGHARAARMMNAPPCSMYPERPDCIEDRIFCPPICPMSGPGGDALVKN